MKWLTPYQRRLLRKIMRTGKKIHNGRRYLVLVDDSRGLIIVNDIVEKKRYVFIGKPKPRNYRASK